MTEDLREFFTLNFDGSLYIIHEEYKDEIKKFLAERNTTLPYLAKHCSIQEISDFLRNHSRRKGESS